MLNPSLPAGTPYNVFEKSGNNQKYNVSETLVDGDVILNKTDPHIQDLRLLQKASSSKSHRSARLFSIFSLVRFKNTDCTPSTTNSYIGTCYLATQCQEKVTGYLVNQNVIKFIT